MKKSQIKMFETLAILIVFFILLMFGFMFYARIQKSTFQRDMEERTSMQAIEVAERISFLPEIQCSNDNIPKENCIDLLKLNTSASVIDQNRGDYFDVFTFSHVYVREVYPEIEEWQLYDYPKNINSGEILTTIPVSLYDPRDDTYAFGVLYIGSYI